MYKYLLKCHSSTFKSKQIQSLQLSNLSFICFVKHWWKTTLLLLFGIMQRHVNYIWDTVKNPRKRQITSAKLLPKKVNFQDLTLPKSIKLEALSFVN